MSGQHVVFVRSTGVAALSRAIVERLAKMGMSELPGDSESPGLRLQVLCNRNGWVMMRANPGWFWWAPVSDQSDLKQPHGTWFSHLFHDQPSAWLMATQVTYLPGEASLPRSVLMECGEQGSNLSAVPEYGEPGLFAGHKEHAEIMPSHPLLQKPWQAWRDSRLPSATPDERLGLSNMARNLSRHLLQRDVWTRSDWVALGAETWCFDMPVNSPWMTDLWMQAIEIHLKESQPVPLADAEIRDVFGRRLQVGDRVMNRREFNTGKVLAIMQTGGHVTGVVVRMGEGSQGQRVMWPVSQGVLDEALCVLEKPNEERLRAETRPGRVA